MNSPDDPGGQWLDDARVRTFFLPAHGDSVVVVFVRAGEFDEPLPLTGITEIALRAALAGLPAGHAVRELRVEGLLSSIVLAGDDEDVRQTLHRLGKLLCDPDDERIAAELQRAQSTPEQRPEGPRELHFAKRFGSHGPGMANLARFGAFKAGVGDVAAHARRSFVTGNVALLALGEDPEALSFDLPPGAGTPPAPTEPLDSLSLPARDAGAGSGLSASVELPRTLAGRLALALLTQRLEARGTLGDVASVVEPVGEHALIGLLAARVTDAFVEEAGGVVATEAAALAQQPPSADELRQAGAAWLAQITAAPLTFGRFVVGERLLGGHVGSRSDLVDQLWAIEPDGVSLAAQLMRTTMLLLLPPGVAIEALPQAEPAPVDAEPVKGRRFRPVGMATSWAAHARGFLFVGDTGISHVARGGDPRTILFASIEVAIDFDDGTLVLIGRETWLHVDPRLWTGADAIRATVLGHVAADRVVPVPRGQAAQSASLAFVSEQKAARRSVAKALAILAGTIALVGLLALWGGSGDGDPRRDAACATVAGDRATRVDCDAEGAEARVLTVTVLGDGRQCPRNTDAIVAVAETVSEYACLRSLKPPHAGERGKGGGVLLAGDCIADPAGGLADPETPCGSATEYAEVAAIALGAAQCPRSAVDVARLATTSDYRTLCLAGGPGVMTKGDCVTDPVVTEFVEVRCATPEAAFRVTARVAAMRACPAGTAATGRPPRALPRTAVACLGRR